MDVGASFALKPPMPPLHGPGGGRLGIIEAPATWPWGPPLLWDHRGPRGMGMEASFALGSSMPPPHGRAGLRFGIIKAPAAWAQGPP